VSAGFYIMSQALTTHFGHISVLCVLQMGRDVFNEKPSTEELLAAEVGANSALPRGACVHTTKVRRDPVAAFMQSAGPFQTTRNHACG
jgi:hypothetical protein